MTSGHPRRTRLVGIAHRRQLDMWACRQVRQVVAFADTAAAHDAYPDPRHPLPHFHATRLKVLSSVTSMAGYVSSIQTSAPLVNGLQGGLCSGRVDGER